MTIHRTTPTDAPALLDVWLRSVRATHTFLTDADLASLLPDVRDYLASATELWTLRADDGLIVGFMGLTGPKVDALFLAPDHHRRGGGRLLLRHARSLHPTTDLTVDVNEQNPAAVRFYEACGFTVTARSETDTAGRPFPLLHMRLAGLVR